MKELVCQKSQKPQFFGTFGVLLTQQDYFSKTGLHHFPYFSLYDYLTSSKKSENNWWSNSEILYWDQSDERTDEQSKINRTLPSAWVSNKTLLYLLKLALLLCNYQQFLFQYIYFSFFCTWYIIYMIYIKNICNECPVKMSDPTQVPNIKWNPEPSFQ